MCDIKYILKIFINYFNTFKNKQEQITRINRFQHYIVFCNFTHVQFTSVNASPLQTYIHLKKIKKILMLKGY